MNKISAVLIVRDEEKSLEACLKALNFADEIVIVDSGSIDHTLDIARKYTPRIYRRPFDNFASQKNYAIDQAMGKWILSLDADEIVSPGLAKSIQDIKEKGSGFDGFYVRRKNLIFGKALRFAGQGREKILRVFKKEKGKFEQPIHEKVIAQGPVGELEGDLIHNSTPTLAVYFQKMNFYTDREAKWLYEKGVRPHFGNFCFDPLIRFIYFYFIRLGFLDGYEGFLYHALSSVYYFVKYAKLKEFIRYHENRD